MVRSNRDLYVQIEKLKLIAAEQAQVIAEQKEQLQIKSDAILRQTEDIKKLDAELVWARAALQQTEQKSDVQDQAEWQDKYIRLQAEIDNLRKRWENKASEKAKEERNHILKDMLPLADHLEMALRHGAAAKDATEDERRLASSGLDQTTSIDSAFISNIRATQSAFLGTLLRYDIKPIEALGKPFDPTMHEAVGQTDQTTVPPDHVAEVLQTGYQDGERLLRPARVIVSKGK